MQTLIRSGAVRVDEQTAKPNHRLASGECVRLQMPPVEEPRPKPEAIPLDIVYEDEFVIVVNKPPGMVVHPAPGHSGGTLVNALLYHCRGLSGIGGERRPGIVHRLDRDTSGLLVVAKNDAAHQALSESLACREAARRYLAIVAGAPPERCGRIEAPVGRSRTDRTKMAIDPKRGRPAVTHWEVERWGPGITVLRLRLDTGRTHQIRVHLASRRMPVIGDRVYGWTSKREIELVPHAQGRLIQALSRVQRHQLHASHLEFPHPADRRPMQFEAPPPPDMRALLDAIPALPTREDLERESSRPGGR